MSTNGFLKSRVEALSMLDDHTGYFLPTIITDN